MTSIPEPLALYMKGLRTHDIDMIAASFSDETVFTTPVRTMNKSETLDFLTSLYTGFPDWHYDNDPPEFCEGITWRVNWRQGGTHSHALALPGFPIVEATHKSVKIPEHFFYYRVTDDAMIEVRPDPVPGGAPRGIFEQIGVELPPL